MPRWSTGKYRSRKSGKIYDYKSSWEAIYMDQLDSSPDIAEWFYEPCQVVYLHITKLKKYLPDFLVVTKDKHQYLVEIKPEKMREVEVNALKRSAVLQKCEEEGWIYYEWQPGQSLLPFD